MSPQTSPTHTLVLVRHSKASHDAATDIERPLTERGQRMAEDLAREIDRALGSPDILLVSPAARARQTAMPIRDRLHPGTVRVEEDIYTSGPHGWLEMLAALEEEHHTAVVVGHEPTVSSLAASLHSAARAVAGTELPGDTLARHIAFGVSTATAVVLSVPGSWANLATTGAELEQVIVAPR